MKTRRLVVVLAAIVTLGVPAGAEEIPTLEDIQIEGQIDVPEVLFITARERITYTDFAHRLIMRPSLEVARSSSFPAWLALAWMSPLDPTGDVPGAFSKE